MMEIWKDIPEFEKIYQASTLGRVRGLDRKTGIKRIQGKILKPRKTRGGYLFVSLYKDGVESQLRINRIIAMTFIPNPDGLPQVGHRNDARQDNRVANLYWTTARENLTHNDRHKKVGEKEGKAIIGRSGQSVVTFASSLEAQRHGFNASAIRNCLIGLSKHHRGYSWDYI